MSYSTIFPDFDDAASCERLASLGFTDESYVNDTCPSFDRDGITIYIDYADAALSEFTGRDDLRFTVIDPDTDEQFLFADLDHAIMYHTHLTAEA